MICTEIEIVPEANSAKFAQIRTLVGERQERPREALERGAKEPAPKVIRLAEEYIEVSRDCAFTIEELASQANTGIRSFYASFSKYQGYSPMAFAKTVRLRRARQMLLEVNQRNSVSRVDCKRGFGNLRHFANDFRKMFGELSGKGAT